MLYDASLTEVSGIVPDLQGGLLVYAAEVRLRLGEAKSHWENMREVERWQPFAAYTESGITLTRTGTRY
ncbi:hypothetical protein D3C72_2433560 [compost metagenome]